MREAANEVISVRVATGIAKALEAVPNRSEFVRQAIEAALGNACPLCSGAGVLSPHRRQHWLSFMKNHSLVECETCHEPFIECSYSLA